MGFFQNLFGKKSESRAEEFKKEHPKLAESAVCHFLIVDPAGGRPKPGPSRPKKAHCYLFQVYESGAVGCVNSFESPGAFKFNPISKKLHLISHQWNPSEILLHARPFETSFEKVGEFGLEGFVAAQQSISDSKGVVLLSDLMLRKYVCDGQTSKCLQPFMNCQPKTSLAYEAKGDRLWVAGGALSKVDSVSKDDIEVVEVLEDSAYDGIWLVGEELFLKARRRNSRMNDVVVVDHFKIAEDGELEKVSTLDQLYGPRTIDVHPNRQLLFAGGWTTDPYIRCFRLDGEKSELVGEVKVEIENPFDRLYYREPGVLIAKTEKKLFVFSVSASGQLELTTDIAQCCVSFLD